MLEAYSSGKTIASGGVVPFDSVKLLKGETAVLSGSGAVQLNRCGVYSVTAVVDGTPAAAGAATIQINQDGVAVASITDPLAVTTVGVTLTLPTLIQVKQSNGPCCCKSPSMLQVVNAGVGLNNANTRIVITKVC